MEANIVDNFFYNKGTKLDINVPDVADVSAADYTAKKYTRFGEEDNTSGEQRPFILCHPVSLRLKALTWLDKEITWTFEAGKDPVPLKKIFVKEVTSSTCNQQPATCNFLLSFYNRMRRISLV